MFQLIILLLLLALIGSLLGFAGFAAAAFTVAKGLFVLFLIVCALFFLLWVLAGMSK